MPICITPSLSQLGRSRVLWMPWAAASLEALPSWPRDLLETERVGHLGLLDDNAHPRVLPVTYAVVADRIWSAVDDKPKGVPGERLARVRWLRARPGSALTVDRYDDDWGKLAWVQLIGGTTVFGLAGNEDVLNALRERYPQYRERAPQGPLLCLAPERIVYWRAAGR
jgi:PPOX class probable F420-dependent enzyme